MDALGWHPATCAPHQRGFRHNGLRDELAAIAREARHSASIEQLAVELPEPPIRAAPVHRRADVRIATSRNGDPMTFLDVTVTATAHWDGAAGDAGAWQVWPCGARCREAEQDKRRRWAEEDEPLPGAPRLVPVAFEAQGRLGPAGQALLGAWARQHLAPLQLEPLAKGQAMAAFLKRWRCRLSCALQRGNAELVAASLRPAPTAAMLGERAAGLWEAVTMQ